MHFSTALSKLQKGNKIRRKSKKGISIVLIDKIPRFCINLSSDPFLVIEDVLATDWEIVEENKNILPSVPKANLFKGNCRCQIRYRRY